MYVGRGIRSRCRQTEAGVPEERVRPGRTKFKHPVLHEVTGVSSLTNNPLPISGHEQRHLGVSTFLRPELDGISPFRRPLSTRLENLKQQSALPASTPRSALGGAGPLCGDMVPDAARPFKSFMSRFGWAGRESVARRVCFRRLYVLTAVAQNGFRCHIIRRQRRRRPFPGVVGRLGPGLDTTEPQTAAPLCECNANTSLILLVCG